MKLSKKGILIAIIAVMSLLTVISAMAAKPEMYVVRHALVAGYYQKLVDGAVEEWAWGECNLMLMPEKGIVFCSFSNNYKITPEMFDIWMNVLAKVDSSVLWLVEDNADASRNLRNEAKRHDIDPERLVFASRVQLPEHLARHRLADLFLDTLPYKFQRPLSVGYAG